MGSKNRIIAALPFGSLLLLLTGPALANPPDPSQAPQTPQSNSVYQSFEAGKSARSAGALRGRIVSVDYSTGELTVQSGRETQSITVLPSTTLYHGRQYATLSDLHPGERVEIDISEIDGRLVAQTIRF
jgi:hypothetical protein